MKKYTYIYIAIISVFLFSCETDTSQNPIGKITKKTEIVDPINGSTVSLNPLLANEPATTVKWSSASFGFEAAVTYILELDADTGDFTAPKTIILGNFTEDANTVHELPILNKKLNQTLNLINGNTFGVAKQYKMRVKATPFGQASNIDNSLTIYSDVVSISSITYNPIDEAPSVYVIGSFGTSSTFADWNINTTGTSNSPLIFSPASDNKYSGFIQMNTPNAQFKFADPDATNLNIKGLGTLQVGTIPGTLISSTDISTGNVIPVPTPGTAGTYYLTADWTTNSYTCIPRKLALKGTSTTNVAKYLTYETNPTSPFYRMYVATNVTITAGNGYIQLKDNSVAADRMVIDGSSQTVQITPDLTSNIKNKLKIGSGGSVMSFLNPGTYTIVLDLKHAANYNLKLIPN